MSAAGSSRGRPQPGIPARAETDLTALEDLAPPCEYSRHREFGSGPAVWAVWLRPNCCFPAPYLVLFCDGCWLRRNATGHVKCAVCHSPLGSAMGQVLRMERIR